MPRNTRTAQSLGGAEPLFLPKSAAESVYTAAVRRASTVIAYSHLPTTGRDQGRASGPAARAAGARAAEREYAPLARRYDVTLSLCRAARIAGDDAAANGYHAEAAVMYARLEALYPLFARRGFSLLSRAA